MVIEWLKFQVTPQLREKFIEKDNQIWTAKLATYRGFLGKEVWIDPHDPEAVILIAHWENYQVWKTIPQTDLDATEKEFSQQMGEGTYQLIESRDYQVRKFPDRS